MTLTAHIRKQLPRFMLDVSLTCAPSTITAIVGPSGAGKTTFIRCLAGLEHADYGDIRLGTNLWHCTEQRCYLPTRKRRLGFLFQDYPLFPHLTVLGNLVFSGGNKAHGLELLERFGIAHLAQQYPMHLSGGEKQRVAFCQALARDIDILLLDEPFSALDIATRRQLRQLVLDLKKELNIPIIHVTHDIAEALQLGDVVLAINNGGLDHDWLGKARAYSATEHHSAVA